jgi:hypothetical protein
MVCVTASCHRRPARQAAARAPHDRRTVKIIAAIRSAICGSFLPPGNALALIRIGSHQDVPS